MRSKRHEAEQQQQQTQGMSGTGGTSSRTGPKTTVASHQRVADTSAGTGAANKNEHHHHTVTNANNKRARGTDGINLSSSTGGTAAPAARTGRARCGGGYHHHHHHTEMKQEVVADKDVLQTTQAASGLKEEEPVNNISTHKSESSGASSSMKKGGTQHASRLSWGEGPDHASDANESTKPATSHETMSSSYTTTTNESPYPFGNHTSKVTGVTPVDGVSGRHVTVKQQLQQAQLRFLHHAQQRNSVTLPITSATTSTSTSTPPLMKQHFNIIPPAPSSGADPLPTTTTMTTQRRATYDYTTPTTTTPTSTHPHPHPHPHPPPHVHASFCVNPPLFPMHSSSGQQENVDSRWSTLKCRPGTGPGDASTSNWNGASSVPSRMADRIRAYSSGVNHGGGHSTVRTGGTGNVVPSSQERSTNPNPTDWSPSYQHESSANRITFDPEPMDSYPRTPHGGTVEQDKLDADALSQKQRTTKVGVVDVTPLNCTATPSRNMTVPSPTNVEQESRGNNDEAAATGTASGAQNAEVLEQQARTKAAQRDLERKTFYVDTITKNEACSLGLDMFPPNLYPYLNDGAGAAAAAECCSNDGATAFSSGARRTTRDGDHGHINSGAAARGSTHTSTTRSGAAARGSRTAPNQQHPKCSPRGHSRDACAADTDTGISIGVHVHNCGSSSGHQGEEDGSQSPLLFIHRRIEQHSGSDDDEDDDDMSCSLISTSSNGSEIKKRLRHALIGAAADAGTSTVLSSDAHAHSLPTQTGTALTGSVMGPCGEPSLQLPGTSPGWMRAAGAGHAAELTAHHQHHQQQPGPPHSPWSLFNQQPLTPTAARFPPLGHGSTQMPTTAPAAPVAAPRFLTPGTMSFSPHVHRF